MSCGLTKRFKEVLIKGYHEKSPGSDLKRDIVVEKSPVQVVVVSPVSVGLCKFSSQRSIDPFVHRRWPMQVMRTTGEVGGLKGEQISIALALSESKIV